MFSTFISIGFVLFFGFPVVMQWAIVSRGGVAQPKADTTLTAEEVTTIYLREEDHGLLIRIGDEQITAEELPARLQELAQKRPDQKIQIRAKADTPCFKVHDIINACSQAGLNDIIIGAPLPDTNP